MLRVVGSHCADGRKDFPREELWLLLCNEVAAMGGGDKSSVRMGPHLAAADIKHHGPELGWYRGVGLLADQCRDGNIG